MKLESDSCKQELSQLGENHIVQMLFKFVRSDVGCRDGGNILKKC